jgi:hypothetical protein
MYRALAASGRVPEVIRVEALRALAERFHLEPNDRLLAQLIESPGGDAPRHLAFRMAVSRSGFPLEPIARLALDESAAVGLRIRAVRHLGAQADKTTTRPHLDRLLESADPRVARAALLALFSTLRYTPADRVEAALVNLLAGHAQPEVRASAARALGVFGRSHASLEALRRARGLFSPPAVNAAVDGALERRRLEAEG